MEVLDNLTHDQVVRVDNRLYEVRIVEKSTEDGKSVDEEWVSLQDPRLGAFVTKLQSLSERPTSYLPFTKQELIPRSQLLSFFQRKAPLLRHRIGQPLTGLDLSMPSIDAKIGFSTMWLTQRFSERVRARHRRLIAYKRLGLKQLPKECSWTYIPTSAQLLLERLRQSFPQQMLCLGDFSFLPTSCDGVLAPVISTKSFQPTDFQSVLAEPGECDIFFPTDFAALQQLCAEMLPPIGSSSPTATRGHITQVLSFSSFMRQYANVAATQTANGWCAAEEDYVNFNMLVSAPPQSKRSSDS